jgi:hypothetical protein
VFPDLVDFEAEALTNLRMPKELLDVDHDGIFIYHPDGIIRNILSAGTKSQIDAISGCFQGSS